MSTNVAIVFISILTVTSCCPKYYQPVCGYHIKTSVLTTFHNICEFRISQERNPGLIYGRHGKCVETTTKENVFIGTTSAKTSILQKSSTPGLLSKSSLSLQISSSVARNVTRQPIVVSENTSKGNIGMTPTQNLKTTQASLLTTLNPKEFSTDAIKNYASFAGSRQSEQNLGKETQPRILKTSIKPTYSQRKLLPQTSTPPKLNTFSSFLLKTNQPLNGNFQTVPVQSNPTSTDVPPQKIHIATGLQPIVNVKPNSLPLKPVPQVLVPSTRNLPLLEQTTVTNTQILRPFTIIPLKSITEWTGNPSSSNNIQVPTEKPTLSQFSYVPFTLALLQIANGQKSTQIVLTTTPFPKQTERQTLSQFGYAPFTPLPLFG